jgi:hypothetical protein
VTLSPAIFVPGSEYWVATDLGTVGGSPAAYDGQEFGPGDTIASLAPIVISMVPEPSSFALLSIAGMGLLARRRKGARGS